MQGESILHEELLTGERVTYENYTFTVESSDERSIGEVRIKIDKKSKIEHTNSSDQN